MHAVPVQHAWHLYAASPRGWDDTEIIAAQAYAGIVASLLLAAAKAELSGVLADQLQTALDSRGLIERAKGALMEREHLDDQEAFTHLRRAARSSGRKLSQVAGEVAAGLPLRDGPGPRRPQTSSPPATLRLPNQTPERATAHGPMSAAAESGRSLASSAFREGRAPSTGAWQVMSAYRRSDSAGIATSCSGPLPYRQRGRSVQGSFGPQVG